MTIRLSFSTLLVLLSVGAVSPRSIANPTPINSVPIVIAENLTAQQFRERGDDRSIEDAKGAIEDYTRAIRLAPNEMGYYHARAAAYIRNNDKASALEDYNQAIKVAPESPSAYGERAIFYCTEANYQKAIADWDQTVKLMPASVAFSQRADCLAKSGDYKKAITDLDQALTLDPKSGYLYNQRALAKLSLGQKQAALQDFQQAAKAYGNGPEYDEVMESIKALQ